jgi:hypothetical protein
MMGRQNVDQASLFYEFRLEDRILKSYLLKRITAAPPRVRKVAISAGELATRKSLHE